MLFNGTNNRSINSCLLYTSTLSRLGQILPLQDTWVWVRERMLRELGSPKIQSKSSHGVLLKAKWSYFLTPKPPVSYNCNVKCKNVSVLFTEVLPIVFNVNKFVIYHSCIYISLSCMNSFLCPLYFHVIVK